MGLCKWTEFFEVLRGLGNGVWENGTIWECFLYFSYMRVGFSLRVSQASQEVTIADCTLTDIICA